MFSTLTRFPSWWSYFQAKAPTMFQHPTSNRLLVTSPQQHFGDLQGGHERLQEREREILSKFPSPLDRLVLTADGTLQLLVSAWHNRVVKVKPLQIVEHVNELRVEREVELYLGDENGEANKPFCYANSTLLFAKEELMRAVPGSGIGQMFRQLNILPTYELLDAARNKDTGELWRKYKLCAPGVSCSILETFPVNPLMIPIVDVVDDTNGGHLVAKGKVESSGVTSDARLSGFVRPQLTPIQRVFCSAIGNVQRLASAALGESVIINLLFEEINGDGNFTRQVELLSGIDSKRFCLATSSIQVHDDALLQKLKSGELRLGAIVAELGAYPTFQLLHTDWVSSTFFTRRYRLILAKGKVELVVNEEFDWSEFPQLNETNEVA